MAGWESFIQEIQTEIERLDDDGCQSPFYRGHRDTTWRLKPSLYRIKSNKPCVENLETSLHDDFTSNCGPLNIKNEKSWDLLFQMRHAGLPTRILDWTENFAASLFFAIQNYEKTQPKHNGEKNLPCIWIMDPYKLNKKYYGIEEVHLVDNLPFTYDDILWREQKKIMKYVKGPIAILTRRDHPRIFAQKSVFTLNVKNFLPIEKKYECCVKKINIPLDGIEDAKKFLVLSGINDYSLFPDLDGLGKWLKNWYEIKNR
jgi:hypothetical protein